MKKLTLTDGIRSVGEVRTWTFEGDLPPFDEREMRRFLDDHAYADVWARQVGQTVQPNLVVNAGRARLVALSVQESTTRFSYIALSTSTVSPSQADTSLTSELIRKAASIVSSYATYYIRVVANFGTTSFNSTGIVGEGVFDTASTGGTMLADASISLSKTNTQSAVVEHRVLMST